ncbi:hypothetical protein KRM28CT15_01320 [Krasilnikovia sp. M28-CT-15]
MQAGAAAGIAAGTGAAQLGLGYGLGVVEWPTTAGVEDSVWLGSLGWATWIAASATVFGAVLAGRMPTRTGGPWRLALAGAAALGALLTVALIALPARAAVRPDTFAPQTVAAGYALLGVVLGLVVAYWAVVSRPAAANLVATATWLWILAAAAVIAELTLHRPSATYLNSWQFAAPGTQYGIIALPSALLTLLAAAVLGVIGAVGAVRRGDRGVGAATSGAVGPLLVATAFLALAPQLTGSLGSMESAYLIAPYAVVFGLAGSAATVALAERRATAQALAGRGVTVPGQAVSAEDTAPTGRWVRRSASGSSPQEREVPGQRDAAERKPETTRGAGAADTATTAREGGTAPAKSARGRAAAARDEPGDATSADTSRDTPAKGAPGGAAVRRTGAGKAAPAKAGSGKAAPGKPPRKSPGQAGQASPSPAGPGQAAPSAVSGRGTSPVPVTSLPTAPPPATPPPTAPPPTAPRPEPRPTPVPDRPQGAKAVGRAATSSGGSQAGPAGSRKDAPESRSTVAPPPAEPPVADINPDDPAAEPKRGLLRRLGRRSGQDDSDA